MNIDFIKYPNKILSVKFHDDTYDSGYIGFSLYLDNNIKFIFTTYNSTTCTGVFKQWLDYDFSQLIGKVIIKMTYDDFPDELYPEYIQDDDDDRHIYFDLLTFHLNYGTAFKFIFVNYSICSCCTSFIKSSVSL